MRGYKYVLSHTYYPHLPPGIPTISESLAHRTDPHPLTYIKPLTGIVLFLVGRYNVLQHEIVMTREQRPRVAELQYLMDGGLGSGFKNKSGHKVNRKGWIHLSGFMHQKSKMFLLLTLHYYLLAWQSCLCLLGCTVFTLRSDGLHIHTISTCTPDRLSS